MFQLQKHLATWHQCFVKMVLKNFFLLSKNSKFCTFQTIQFVSNFASMSFKYISSKVWTNRLLVSAFATVARKSFNGRFTAKLDFPSRHFMLPLLILILEVQSLSIHYLIIIWSTCWWNSNKTLWYEIYKILSFLANNG